MRLFMIKKKWMSFVSITLSVLLTIIIMNAVCVTEAKADTLYAYPISEGWYYISPQCAPSRCLDVAGGRTDSGTNIQIYSRNYSGAQLFHLTYIGDGYYIITSYLGKVLDGQGGRSKSGTNIHTWDFNNGYNQAFRIENAGGASCKI